MPRPEHRIAGTILVRTMATADLPMVARVHGKAFRGFFLDQMGAPFLRQYYATVLAYQQGLSIVAVDQAGDIVGFAAGFVDPAGFYAHFRRRRLRFLPAIAMAVLRRPRLLKRIMENSRRVEDAGPSAADVAELASIGVSASGGGVGSLLLSEFCGRAFAEGARLVTLTTDNEDNASTQTFYENRGFRHTGDERRGERVLRRYELRPAPG